MYVPTCMLVRTCSVIVTMKKIARWFIYEYPHEVTFLPGFDLLFH